MRRIAGIVAVLVGAFFIVLPFALQFFSRLPAAERLTDSVRPAMTEEGLGAIRSGFDVGAAAGTEFVEDAVPGLAAELGQSEEELLALVERDYPAVARGIDELPEMIDYAGGVITLLEDQRENFEAADAIPVTSAPMSIGAWGSLLAGAAFVVLGAIALSDRSRMALAAIFVLGLATALGPLAVSMPQKASDGAELVDALRPSLSREGADRIKHWLGTLQAMAPQVKTEMLPDLARELGLTDEEMSEFLTANHPDVAEGAAQADDILVTFGDLVARVDANVDEYAKTKELPLRAMPWTLIVPGAIAALAGGVGLLARRRPAAA